MSDVLRENLANYLSLCGPLADHGTDEKEKTGHAALKADAKRSETSRTLS